MGKTVLKLVTLLTENIQGTIQFIIIALIQIYKLELAYSLACVI